MCNVACGFNVICDNAVPSFGVNDGGNPYPDKIRLPGNTVRTVQVRQMMALTEFKDAAMTT